MKSKVRFFALAFSAILCLCAIFVAACGDASVVYSVTFDQNYDGGERQTVEVESGDSVPVPQDPAREGYTFSGWYEDSDCTSPYDFSAQISSDETIYAGWIVVNENEVTITYMWNYDDMGVCHVDIVEKNTLLTSLYQTARDGYALAGWYTEAECENPYRFGGTNFVTENVTLYALWYRGQIFEAEYTDLMEPNDPSKMRDFEGYSNNGTGLRAGNDASNGYYIGDMYINEAYIYFEIECDRDVPDAMMTLNLALDYGFYVSSISDSQYTITVNGGKLSYAPLTFDNSELGTGEMTPFNEYDMGKISLQEGTNTIKLQVTNEVGGQGGSMRAIAPLVDYMELFVPEEATLSWNPVTSNIS